MLETLDYTIRIGSIPTFLYFDLYLYSAYAAHFVYIYICSDFLVHKLCRLSRKDAKLEKLLGNVTASEHPSLAADTCRQQETSSKILYFLFILYLMCSLYWKNVYMKNRL